MYTMMQVCRRPNMTYETLKYYCNEGLVPNVKRDGNNRRVFDQRDVKWIQDLVCLKKMRDEHPGDEGLPGPLPPKGRDHPPAEGDAGPKAGRPYWPPSKNWRTAWPISTGSSRSTTKCSPANAPYVEQPDRPQRVTR